MSATITMSPTVTEELPRVTISSRTKSEAVRSSADHVYGRKTETIVFDDCPTGLGIKIVGGAADDGDDKDQGVFIKKIIFGGLVSADGRLQEGDEVLEVNGDSLSGLTNEQAVQLLRQAAASNYFKFIITRDEISRRDFEHCLEYHGALSRSTSSAADRTSVCSHASSKSPREPRSWSSLSPGGRIVPPVFTSITPPPDSSNNSSRSNTPHPLHPQEVLPSNLIRDNRFPGEFQTVLGTTTPPVCYTPPLTSGCTSPSCLSEIEACISASSTEATPPTSSPAPLPAYGAPLPKVDNATAAAFPLQRGPLLKPSHSSTPQAPSFTAGFLVSKSSTPQVAGCLTFSPGEVSSVFEPSPVASAENPSLLPGAGAGASHSGELLYLDGLQVSPPQLAFSPGEGEDGGMMMSEVSKLSLDPQVQLKVEKLETALHYLGLDPTPEQQLELRKRVPVDSTGSVTYGDFVRVARDIFKAQLAEKHFGPGHPFTMDHIDHIDHFKMVNNAGVGDRNANISAVLTERDSLRGEIIRLQTALREKERACSIAEEELLRVRKEAQQAIIHNRSLQSKVHLVEQAQRASRSMEQDYEEVVRLLESELSEHKARDSKIMDHPEVLKQIAILTCQLRKVKLSKKTYEVATEKLLQFVESLHEVLTGQGDGFTFRDPSREPTGRGPRPPGYLGKHKLHTPLTLAAEAREVVKTVQSLIEVEPLPFGWDEAYTEDGLKYYIDHKTQVTSWVHPLSKVEHVSSSRPGSTHGRPPPPMPTAKRVEIAETRT